MNSAKLRVVVMHTAGNNQVEATIHVKNGRTILAHIGLCDEALVRMDPRSVGVALEGADHCFALIIREKHEYYLRRTNQMRVCQDGDVVVPIDPPESTRSNTGVMRHPLVPGNRTVVFLPEATVVIDFVHVSCE